MNLPKFKCDMSHLDVDERYRLEEKIRSKLFDNPSWIEELIRENMSELSSDGKDILFREPTTDIDRIRINSDQLEEVLRRVGI